MGTKFLEFPDWDEPVEVAYGPLDLSTWAKIRRAADLYGPGCSIDKEQVLEAALEHVSTLEMRGIVEHYFDLCRQYPDSIPLHFAIGEVEILFVDKATSDL